MGSFARWSCRKEVSRGWPPAPHNCQAAFPYQGMMDAKALLAEEAFDKAKTPEELFQMIPKVPPLGVGRVLEEWPNENGLFVAEKQYPGHYHFTNSMTVRSLPRLDWNVIFSLVGPGAAESARKEFGE